jgi:glutamate-5-semialdehyde dehydrogenase
MSGFPELQALGDRARDAARALRVDPPERRTAALLAAAASLRDFEARIMAANAEDVAAACAAGRPEPMVDRLTLRQGAVEPLARTLEDLAARPDPVGGEVARWTRPNGLDIARVSTPIGVIAVIFESRPNVTVEAAGLCLRSGNAALLRGGSEALRTNLALFEALSQGIAYAGLPDGAVQMPATEDRAAVGAILSGLNGTIDLIIPRGGRSLLERVKAEARAPVLGHLEGLCHTYLHAAADPDMAEAVVVNAKMRRTSVCGATETLLVDAAAAERLLPRVAAALRALGCELRGDENARRMEPGIAQANEVDWRTEHLAPILNVRVVADLDAAVHHIETYGSGHTDAIVTDDPDAAAAFTARVDSAVVLVNASTQFSDGGEFGFGAEIGIATDRIHARGPVGAEQLTTFKYVVRGAGQVRP